MSKKIEQPAPPPSVPAVDENRTASEDRVPVATKVVYGLGTANDMWGNWLYPGLVNPVFNIHLGLAPWLISMTMMLQRVFDAITDPILGWLSDNTRTRWGRRRPWILFGGIASGLALPVLFMVNPDWSKGAIFVYMLVTALLYMPIISAYNMPYQSLGSELTPDYHERTRVMAFKGIIQKFTEIAFFLGIPFATLEWFRIDGAVDAVTGLPVDKYDMLTGARTYCMIIGALMIGVSILNFLVVKERYYKRVTASHQEKLPIRDAFLSALKCRPFRLLLATNLAVGMGTSMVGTLGFYCTVYYVCGGDLKIGGYWNMLMGFAYSGGAILSVPIITWLSRHLGKRHAALINLAFAICAFGATWWLYNPDLPWIQPFASGVIAMSTSALGVLVGSMVADTMDYDELESGKRREGSFSSCFSWFTKLGLALGMGASGVVLSGTGFNAEFAEQTASALFNIRFYLAAIPILGISIAFVLFWRYPLTHGRMAEIRKELERIRGKV